jgi:hypothetical protein
MGNNISGEKKAKRSEQKKTDDDGNTFKLSNRWSFFAERQPMVGWYAQQLFATGLDLLVSTKLSSSHDVRMLNALQRRHRPLIINRSGNDKDKEKEKVGDGPDEASRNVPPPFRPPPWITYEDESETSGKERDDLWFDFVADIGDGFDSCYTITYLQTRPELNVTDPDHLYQKNGGSVKTFRGDVLLLGGDLAYPVPSIDAYNLRFKKLYEMSFPWSSSDVPGCERYGPSNHPKCLAVPGNHDWYDSLTIFSSLFLRGHSADSLYTTPSQIGGGFKRPWPMGSNPGNASNASSSSGRPPLRKEVSNDATDNKEEDKEVNQVWLGGYVLGQDQTYFACKLPKNWWIFGIDLGLYMDIDVMQLRYFLSVVKEVLQDGESYNIIMMCHEPLWWFKTFKGFPMNLKKLLRTCKNFTTKTVSVRLWLAGDVHNYRRDSDVPFNTKLRRFGSTASLEKGPKGPLLTTDGFESQYHKVVAGGGGAFLHPTWLGVDNNAGHVDMNRKYVMGKVYPSSKTSTFLAFKNLLFPFYNRSFGLVTAGLYGMLLWWVTSSVGDAEGLDLFDIFFKFQNPMPTSIAAVLTLACVYFADGGAIKKVIQGGVHAAGHIAGIYGVYNFAQWVASHIAGRAGQIAATAACYIGGGYLVGSFIMGVYLLGSALAGTHWNESYSSFKCEDYKSFVRVHIDQNGDLELFAIGTDKANKKWKVADESPKDYREPLIAPKKEYEAKLVDYIKLRRKLRVEPTSTTIIVQEQ